MDFAKINDWLYVGNRNACGMNFVRACVHINRSDYPTHDCRRHIYPLQVELDYRDGDELTQPLVQSLLVFVSGLRNQKVPTLVHCHAGACRSPTIAGFVLGIVDNLHPIDAWAAVEKAIYDQQEHHTDPMVCNVCYYPKKQLVRLMERQRQGV